MATSTIKRPKRSTNTVELASSNFQNGFTVGTNGSVSWQVISGVCFVTIKNGVFTQEITSEKTFITGLPLRSISIYSLCEVSGSSLDFIFVQAGSSGLVIGSVPSAYLNRPIYGTIVYPVSDSWTT